MWPGYFGMEIVQALQVSTAANEEVEHNDILSVDSKSNMQFLQRCHVTFQKKFLNKMLRRSLEQASLQKKMFLQAELAQMNHDYGFHV